MTIRPDLKPQRGAHPVDLHVGGRIRARRRQRGISQQALADALGLTFQQIQKYEQGTNRVSASRLWEIAAVLEAPVAHFYEGLEGAAPDTAPAGGLGSTVEERAVASAFARLRGARVRRTLLELVEAAAETSAHTPIPAPASLRA